MEVSRIKNQVTFSVQKAVEKGDTWEPFLWLPFNLPALSYFWDRKI